MIDRVNAEITAFTQRTETQEAFKDVIQYLDRTRKNNWTYYFLQDWKKRFTAADLPIHPESSLRVELIGPLPLRNLVNKAAPRFASQPRAGEDHYSRQRRDIEQKLKREESSWFKNLENVSKLKATIAELDGAILTASKVGRELQERTEGGRLLLRQLVQLGWKRERLITQCKRLTQELEHEGAYIEKHAVAYAKAAALDGKSRSQVKILAGMIQTGERCPYCNEPLGDQVCLDHIYPVAKGGLSIPENLIYCCPQCNLRKSDNGLYGFIEYAGFSFQDVINRLRSQGKHV